jgi:hypothetical protein
MPAGQPDRSLGAELRAPTRYPDGSTDETSEALDVIADLLAAPADPRRRVTACRECMAVFAPSVDSATKWGTVCGPCLRAMGCL